MPAWIHVKSESPIVRRCVSATGCSCAAWSLTVGNVGGHQFITFHLTFWQSERVAVDIEHHTIFRIAE